MNRTKTYAAQANPPYMPLSTPNVRQNNIPPRLMWNINDKIWTASSSGYCGETSLQCAGLLYGQYVPQYDIRMLVADYYAQLGNQFSDTYESIYGSGSTVVTVPGAKGDTVQLTTDNIRKHGQYCCQFLLGAPDEGTGMEHVLNKLFLEFDTYACNANTQNDFMPWLKQRMLAGQPVITGVQDRDGDDPEYDHIVIVTGWGSDQPLNDFKYYPEDEILFSDHGLIVNGGSIPYFFHFVMETGADGTRPDGGCPGRTVWNFIMDLGTARTIGINPCNSYQLAQMPSSEEKSACNYGLAIRGVKGSNLLPVRIDPDFNYEFPCITTQQAWVGARPTTTQIMTHTITISGMTIGVTYNIWIYHELTDVPQDHFNTAGKGHCREYTAESDQPYVFQLQKSADIAVIVRCLPKGT